MTGMARMSSAGSLVLRPSSSSGSRGGDDTKLQEARQNVLATRETGKAPLRSRSTIALRHVPDLAGLRSSNERVLRSPKKQELVPPLPSLPGSQTTLARQMLEKLNASRPGRPKPLNTTSLDVSPLPSTRASSRASSRGGSKGSNCMDRGDNKKIRLPLGLNSHMALGVKKLAESLNLPFEETHRAVNVFARFTEVESGADVMGVRMSREKFPQVLHYLMHLQGSTDEVTEDIGDKCFRHCDRDGSGNIDVEEFCLWYSSAAFMTEMMLDDKQQKVRKFAQQHGISLVDIETYRSYFNKFDVDGSGAIDFDEFTKLVTVLWKIPKNAEIPEKRMQNFWKMADLDGSGALEFEEFVLFYRKYCESDSGRDPVMDFYRSIRRV